MFIVFFTGHLAVQTNGVHKARVNSKKGFFFGGGGGGLKQEFLGGDLPLYTGTIETLNQTYMYLS